MKLILAFLFFIFAITRNTNGKVIFQNNVENEINGKNYLEILTMNEII